jgi:hypothetical protein
MARRKRLETFINLYKIKTRLARTKSRRKWYYGIAIPVTGFGGP